MPYHGGKSAYPVHPVLACRSEIVLPWADGVFAPVFGGAEDDVDVDEDVGDDFEVGVEGIPPQPAKMVVTRMMRQIFTGNSPALEFRCVRGAHAESMRRRMDLLSELF